MLLLTIALATTLTEASEGNIESHLQSDDEAKLTLRHILEKEITRHLVINGVILEAEKLIVPFVSLTNVEGFGAHD